jgi:hypothetical protein
MLALKRLMVLIKRHSCRRHCSSNLKRTRCLCRHALQDRLMAWIEWPRRMRHWDSNDTPILSPAFAGTAMAIATGHAPHVSLR